MKHVLITGGSDGLGKVTAQKLVEAGYAVTILSHDAGKTKAAADALGCTYVVADVGDPQQVHDAVATAVGQNGEIDVLINSAGMWILGPLESNAPAEINHAIRVNTLGTIYCTQAVVAAMKKRSSGRIVNVISQAGLAAKAERTVYNASKWALTGFTKSLQLELKPYKVGVVGFYPGAMDTGLFEKAGDMKDRKGALNPAIAADALVHICAQSNDIDIPEYGIQSLEY